MNAEPDHEVLDPECKNKVALPFEYEAKIAQLESDLIMVKETNRKNYDAANAYTEISTKVRGENDQLKGHVAELQRKIANYVLAINEASRVMSQGDKLCRSLKLTIPFLETEVVIAKREKNEFTARHYLAQLNEAKVAIQMWEEYDDDYAERREASRERAKGLS